MRVMKQAVPVAVSLAVVSIVTAVLWHLKLAAAGLGHPVFVYLPLVALMAMLYGSLPAWLAAIAATACSAFFLYDPLYSFQVANRLEIGDLVCFALLASIGVKCTGKLLRPQAKISAAKSR